MKNSFGERIFSLFNYLALSLVGIVTLYPFVYILSVSISDVSAVERGAVWLLPQGFNFSAYERLISDSSFWLAYRNSLILLAAGTAVNVLLTICAAYPLSRKRFRGKVIFTFMIAFTMWFKTPMIPFYLMMKTYGMENSISGLIFGFAVSAFYVILLRTYFQSVPDALEESAKIDGANDFIIMMRIYIPLSLPAIATIALYYAVGRWNSYFWAMILLRDDDKIMLQVLLQKLVVQMNLTDQVGMVGDFGAINSETFIYATIVVATLPMLMIYPFVQRYFVKGVMIGAVKG
ncbi:sugar ABC transporter permease [Paenibacillus sp. 598K]|uniref:carbohydrate ABC transporter permease n=1 Tax=Paenibacillus sp. 598K TaxID=1117987 RepID=UPI000FFAA650|nr:carbohydrate ABC transporter permease [Paenibacillus sp. 598K]GBF77305.1 sugar ABC transporter permease [Paenibacillus sp. 598K]